MILGVIDRGLDLVGAVEAPRVHWEDGVVYAEPGVDADALAAEGRKLAPFKDLNVFFGGAQAVRRDPATGELAARAIRAAAARSSWRSRRAAHHELGRERDVGGRAAVERLEQHPPRGAALLDERLADGGQRARRRRPATSS